MAPGGLDICVSATSFQKNDIRWPQQPPTEKVLKFNMIFHDSIQKTSFLKHKNKADIKCLDDSEVLSSNFSDLCSLKDLSDLNSLNDLNDLDSLISSNILLIMMVWLSLAPKWPLPVPFCWIDHQQSNFSLISDTLPVGGCWGQPMSFLWKLDAKTQKSKPPEATRHYKSIKLWILLPLRADLLCILQYETPCITWAK